MAVSGGSDSTALLLLAAEWARAAGRRLLVLTVDHGLHSDSGQWTAAASALAERVGADFQTLAWTGTKPTTGLPAAARRARHALLAQAARDAGARVVLMGHTADDRAEAAAMRASGASVGDPLEWGPSPVWPEGREVMLLRPLMDARRAELQAWLAGQGATWIEDPANVDPRWLRARVRAGGAGSPAAAEEGGPAPLYTVQTVGGGFILRRTDAAASSRLLRAAILCASGREAPPRRERIEALQARLASGDGAWTLAGARIATVRDQVLVAREPGRTGLSSVAVAPGPEVIWDGRFAFVADHPGRLVPAAGLRARLSAADRAELAKLPPAMRGAVPVLLRDGQTAPVLAQAAGRLRPLVLRRLAAALGWIGTEGDAASWADGADGPQPLS
ncbi:tRNA lysidine(34) synthetase TilS [Brevundimonas sp. 2R-24]|uniref:tRNA(Ile)-lysidine synthetase n=1 Tax=Peiella sedimenti TaxID=3061083 RepID=A0ABT8SN70_9CAUL|nr:tRNA lysidine(34) synthetase TilS [Caulobacteraceae bacterium XZ-24]